MEPEGYSLHILVRRRSVTGTCLDCKERNFMLYYPLCNTWLKESQFTQTNLLSIIFEVIIVMSVKYHMIPDNQTT